MLVANLMFSKGLGGIEQSFLDYSLALKLTDNQVISFTSPDASINKHLKKANLLFKSFSNLGQWDLYAKYKIQLYLKELKPDIILAHANRSFNMVKGLSTHIPVVYVVHNYSIKPIPNNISVLATTSHLYQYIIDEGYNGKSIYILPNAIDLHSMPPINTERVKRIFTNNEPAIISTMGRFVSNKGFEYLIEAVAILHKEGYPLKLIIGGTGEEKDNLTNLIHSHNLENIVELPGWISDKAKFFQECDIFVVPSIHEPFGIVVLEGFKYGVPTIVTDTYGPSSIITENIDALLVPKSDSQSMAIAIKSLFQNPNKRLALVTQARHTVESFSLPNFANKLNTYLHHIVDPGKQ